MAKEEVIEKAVYYGIYEGDSGNQYFKVFRYRGDTRAVSNLNPRFSNSVTEQLVSRLTRMSPEQVRQRAGELRMRAETRAETRFEAQDLRETANWLEAQLEA